MGVGGQEGCDRLNGGYCVGSRCQVPHIVGTVDFVRRVRSRRKLAIKDFALQIERRNADPKYCGCFGSDILVFEPFILLNHQNIYRLNFDTIAINKKTGEPSMHIYSLSLLLDFALGWQAPGGTSIFATEASDIVSMRGSLMISPEKAKGVTFCSL